MSSKGAQNQQYLLMQNQVYYDLFELQITLGQKACGLADMYAHWLACILYKFISFEMLTFPQKLGHRVSHTLFIIVLTPT